MSSTAMFRIDPNGVPEEYSEYRNSWGWAAYVWTTLVEKYKLTDEMFDADPDITRGRNDIAHFGLWRYLWHVHARKKVTLEPWEHNVLCATYDNAMVEAKDFGTLAQSLRRFQEVHTPTGVCHCGTMADDLDKLVGTDAIGVCWHTTSVTANPWSIQKKCDTCGQGIDEWEPYNFLTPEEQKHFCIPIVNTPEQLGGLANPDPSEPNPQSSQNDGGGSQV